MDNVQYVLTILSLDKDKVTITNEHLKSWQKEGFIKLIKTEIHEINEKKMMKYERNQLHNKILDFFTPKDRDNDQLNEEFAVLCSHKRSAIYSNYFPILTLGTVLFDHEKEQHLFCLQQRCDSVRICDQRNFFFLPFEESDKNFQFIYKDNSGYRKLAVVNKMFEAYLLAFKADDNGVVSAIKQDDGFIFTDTNEKRYMWLFDVKELHAQKVANEFAANFSRVGIDESEWLRRS